MRLKIGAVEVEAPTRSEIDSLLKLADVYIRNTTPAQAVGSFLRLATSIDDSQCKGLEHVVIGRASSCVCGLFSHIMHDKSTTPFVRPATSVGDSRCVGLEHRVIGTASSCVCGLFPAPFQRSQR